MKKIDIYKMIMWYGLFIIATLAFVDANFLKSSTAWLYTPLLLIWIFLFLVLSEMYESYKREQVQQIEDIIGVVEYHKPGDGDE